VFTQRLRLLGLLGGIQNHGFEPDTGTVNGRLEASLDAALAGQADLARRHLSVLRDFPENSVAHLASAPDVVEALIAASEADWDSVIRILTPMETWTWPHRTRFGPLYGGLILYALAQAHEATNQPDSAAVYYQKLGSPVQLARRWEGNAAGLAYPFAHQRLVLLYSRMDRVEDAARHWRIFSETFTNPDPELAYLVDEAREAFEAAVARAR